VARPISDEELQLKKRARRRLVGAIVLVITAAVLLPMVLDSEPRPVSQNVSIHIPSPDSGEYKPKGPAAAATQDTRPIKGLPEEPAKAATAAPSEARSVASSAEPTPAAKENAKAAAAERSKDRTAAKDPAGEAATPTGAYVVQVAALADAGKAKQLEKRVAGAGLRTYTEVINTQAGERTRVRVGPYATREAAESARAQLKKAGLDGQVVPR